MISDLKARRIASDWHGGMACPLYAFSSTGAIDEDTADAIAISRAATDNEHARSELGELGEYVADRGERGPQVGWWELNW